MFLEDSLVRLGDAGEGKGWGIEGYREGMVGRLGKSVGELNGVEIARRVRAKVIVCAGRGRRARTFREAEEGDLSGVSILGDGDFLGVVEYILDDLLDGGRMGAVSGAERGAPAGNSHVRPLGETT